MGWIDDLRSKVALGRKVEEQLYLVVAEELERGLINQALWLKALEQADGNERRQTAAYIKLRIQALRDEEYLKGQFDREAAVSKRSVAFISPDSAPLFPPHPREPSDVERLRLQGVELFGERQYQKIIKNFGQQPQHAKKARAMLSDGEANSLRDAVETILLQHLRESLRHKERLGEELQMLAEKVGFGNDHKG